MIEIRGSFRFVGVNGSFILEAGGLEEFEFAAIAGEGTFEAIGMEAEGRGRERLGFEGGEGARSAAEGGGLSGEVGRDAIDVFVDEVGFEVEGSEEFPMSGGEVEDTEGFGKADGLVGAMKFVEEVGEGIGAFAFDERGGGGEAMVNGVLGGDGFAGGGDGSAGLGSVEAGGGDLFFGAGGERHGELGSPFRFEITKHGERRLGVAWGSD